MSTLKYNDSQTMVQQRASFASGTRRRSRSLVEPPSTTSKISNPLNFLLHQTRPKCLGRSWNLSTKRLERRLHSGPPYLLDIIIWRLSRRETTSHLCFHSEACLYPQPSLRMPDWGLLQKKMARKNTYNAINLPDLRSFKTPSVMSVT